MTTDNHLRPYDDTKEREWRRQYGADALDDIEDHLSDPRGGHRWFIAGVVVIFAILISGWFQWGP